MPEPFDRTIFTGNQALQEQIKLTQIDPVHTNVLGHVAAFGVRDDSRAQPLEIRGQNSAIKPSVMIEPTKPLEKKTPRLP